MKTTLVINPKGGAGKTTVATNLASYFASRRAPTTILDYDPQGSSLNWVRARPIDAPRIGGANAAPEKFGRLRSFERYVPLGVAHLIIDAPAGVSGLLLQELIERANFMLVPVVPASIDLHATTLFLRELLAMGRVRSGAVRLGIVANKVRRSMPAYPPLQQTLDSLGLRLLARIVDSDVFLRAAECGLGIFEMNPAQSIAEQKQFGPIVEWIAGAQIAPVEITTDTVLDLAQTRAA